MKINPVGITKIIPQMQMLDMPYKELFDFGCTHMRERFLRDGSRLLLGYNNSQKVSMFSQLISPQNYIQRQNITSIDVYGAKKELKEFSKEKNLFNKIGDTIKFTYLIKNYENNKLVKCQKIITDIVEGIDQSLTKITKHNKEEKLKDVGFIFKKRFSPSEYVEEVYSKNGDFINRTTKSVDSKEGLWKY